MAYQRKKALQPTVFGGKNLTEEDYSPRRRGHLFCYTARMAKEVKHTTLYRAYRPADWKEVRGQAQVTDTLEKSIKNGKIAHAYLFSGGRGTGKTSVARILAVKLGVSDKDLY